MCTIYNKNVQRSHIKKSESKQSRGAEKIHIIKSILKFYIKAHYNRLRYCIRKQIDFFWQCQFLNNIIEYICT